MNVWTSVQVTNKKHARKGQAGTVFAVNPVEHPDEVLIKFDTDGTIEAVLIADLAVL